MRPPAILKSLDLRPTSLVWVALLASIVVSFSGCKPPRDPFLDIADATTGSLQVDDLQNAFDLVTSQRSFDQREFDDQVTQGLNRWMKRSLETAKLTGGQPPRWDPSPQVATLFEQFNHLPVAASCGSMNFVPTDGFYLRTQHQLERLATRVAANRQVIPYGFYRELALRAAPQADSEPTLLDCFQSLHPDLPKPEVEQLVTAFQLFDWVIRNIQLLEPTVVPEENWSAEQLSAEAYQDPARSGIRGPGYRRLVGQVLLYGRGDYLERAKLFLALCDQAGLPAALLQIGERPWVVSVFVGNDAYLFDTRLGLPIPAESPGAVATWAQVKANPNLLSGLDLSLEESTRDDVRYWAQPEELGQLKAGVWVTPESLSLRMRYLEDRLVADPKPQITTKHELAVSKAKEILGIDASLLDWEFRTHDFRQTVREALARAAYENELNQRLGWYYAEEYYVDTFDMYRTARHLFFIGRFESDREGRRLSAVEYLYNLMYTDEMIDGLGLNEVLLRRVGILQQRQSTSEFEAALRATQQSMRLVRRDVGLFLPQALFDNNNWGTAENWLGRTGQRSEMDFWRTGIDYMQARARESVRDYPAALGLLRRNEGAQFHGNLIRSRLVQQATSAEMASSN